ncbi:AAA family ATPase [Blastopirellula sp. J2-11]|uniref:AAA family ATPase n=1 Tax=Blastopirellula sp. J2-11 TaxID=2943192 RepID=UPI0021C87782|nr:AAA family ATPase [Blastopirellula sp. J2-11]UUO04853.1 AAA family ATPase [Blastopirellula sp. J2-11]
MANTPADDLLARLAGKHASEEGGDPWASLAATTPAHEPVQEHAGGRGDEKLDSLLDRLNKMASGERGGAPVALASKSSHVDLDDEPLDAFIPREPSSAREAGLTDTEVEALALKYLVSRGEASGRQISDQLRLPFLIVEEQLRKMKYDQLVVYKDTTVANDYVYYPTDLGRERGKRYSEHCTYFGAAPVTLKDYIESVKAQSLEKQHPSLDDLRRAFEDLLINPEMFRRLGPAVNSGRGLFLYGSPGNGKTSIAERVTRAFGQHIWIPRAIGLDGEILRLYDPSNHEEAPLPQESGIMHSTKLDRRWVRIKRPTIVVGGELTMDNLEITFNTATGISEAPVQLKSNCGTLVIDDFGRQRMRTDELLNRWIVPLEKRYDYLNMANGKKIQVPFDQLVIFSTNLEPKDLCDDAFLRRIPYKIEVGDPSESEFRQLFKIMCPLMGFEYHSEVIDYVVQEHYQKVDRPYRCCQPRDLLQQVRNLCLFEKEPLELSTSRFDAAVENYFAVM